VIRLGPSLEKFEEELSLLVQNEYCYQQKVQAGGTAQVIKRYMRVLFVFFFSRFNRHFMPVTLFLSPNLTM